MSNYNVKTTGRTALSRSKRLKMAGASSSVTTTVTNNGAEQQKAVLYTEQQLTLAQQEQARANIGVDNFEVTFAYEDNDERWDISPAYSQVQEAYLAGRKIVAKKITNNIAAFLPLVDVQDDTATAGGTTFTFRFEGVVNGVPTYAECNAQAAVWGTRGNDNVCYIDFTVSGSQAQCNPGFSGAVAAHNAGKLLVARNTDGDTTYIPLYSVVYSNNAISNIIFQKTDGENIFEAEITSTAATWTQRYVSTVSTSQQSLTSAQKMQARKNQGLYYEEEGRVDIEYDGTYEGEDDFVKISDEIPTRAQLLAANLTYRYCGNTYDFQLSDEEIVDMSRYGLDGYIQCGHIIYDADEEGIGVSIIIANDPFATEEGIPKGIYTLRNPDRPVVAGEESYLESISYDATVVHQIETKYIPSVTIPAPTFEVEFTQNQGDEWECSETFEDIMAAHNGGKIVLGKLEYDDHYIWLNFTISSDEIIYFNGLYEDEIYELTIDEDENVDCKNYRYVTTDEDQSFTSSEIETIKTNLQIVDGPTQAKKDEWDAKYDLPQNGIPKYDLSSWVQAALNCGYSSLQPSDLIQYRTAAEQNVIDAAKVDKVQGKGLSTNDYTNQEKSKVASAAQLSDLNNYVEKVQGKGLSTNDYTNQEKSKVASIGEFEYKTGASNSVYIRTDIQHSSCVQIAFVINGIFYSSVTEQSIVTILGLGALYDSAVSIERHQYIRFGNGDCTSIKVYYEDGYIVLYVHNSFGYGNINAKVWLRDNPAINHITSFSSTAPTNPTREIVFNDVTYLKTNGIEIDEHNGESCTIKRIITDNNVSTTYQLDISIDANGNIKLIPSGNSTLTIDGNLQVTGTINGQ